VQKKRFNISFVHEGSLFVIKYLPFALKCKKTLFSMLSNAIFAWNFQYQQRQQK
jgi:hypothetical protein